MIEALALHYETQGRSCRFKSKPYCLPNSIVRLHLAMGDRTWGATKTEPFSLVVKVDDLDPDGTAHGEPIGSWQPPKAPPPKGTKASFANLSADELELAFYLGGGTFLGGARQLGSPSSSGFKAACERKGLNLEVQGSGRRGTVRDIASLDNALFVAIFEGNKRDVVRVAEHLGVDPSAIYRKVEQCGIDLTEGGNFDWKAAMPHLNRLVKAGLGADDIAAYLSRDRHHVRRAFELHAGSAPPNGTEPSPGRYTTLWRNGPGGSYHEYASLRGDDARVLEARAVVLLGPNVRIITVEE